MAAQVAFPRLEVTGHSDSWSAAPMFGVDASMIYFVPFLADPFV